jgi:hypothetical protein
MACKGSGIHVSDAGCGVGGAAIATRYDKLAVSYQSPCSWPPSCYTSPHEPSVS